MKKTYRNLMLVGLAGAMLAVLVPNARAQSIDAKMKVTFSSPVRVPGVVLPKGSYVFQSMDAGHMTRILSADGSQVFGTFFTVPEDRRQVPDEPIVQLGESVSGAPQKVQAWFVPGNSIGDEFLYGQDGN